MDTTHLTVRKRSCPNGSASRPSGDCLLRPSDAWESTGCGQTNFYKQLDAGEIAVMCRREAFAPEDPDSGPQLAPRHGMALARPDAYVFNSPSNSVLSCKNP